MTMVLHFPIFFTVILLLFVVVKAFRSKRTKSKLPPGPWKLPFIGHLHHLGGLLPHHTLGKLSKKHGPLMFLQLGEVPSIVVSSPRLAKEVLKTNDPLFANRGSVHVVKTVTYDGKGILFSPYGQEWKQLRKICMSELLNAKMSQSVMSLIEEEVKILVKDVSLMAGSPVNFSEKLFSLTNVVMTRAAVGKKYEQEGTSLRSLLKNVSALATAFAVADVFPSLKFIHGIGGATRKVKMLHGKIDKIFEDIINDHRVKRKTTNNSGKGGMGEDFVDVLIRLQEDTKLEFPLEDNCLKAVLLEMFMAGSISSPTLTIWALSELLRKPRLMEKVQAEVRRVLDGQKKVSQSDMNKLSYLKLVVKETLRLHPIATLIPRESSENCEIDGYDIPKGTIAFINVWAMGRDPDFWSDDAETFNPERFRDLSVDYNGTNFEYLPFGAGKRICPGMYFGAASLELLLAQLLYHFDWKLPNGTKPEELDMTERFGVVVGRNSNLCLIPTPYSRCV